LRLVGAAFLWAAFYVRLNAQMVWYALAEPWVSSPRPF
jgi:hypothetical protein